MSKVRETINDKSDADKPTWKAWFSGVTTQIVSNGQIAWLWSFAVAKQIGWFVITTGMITALPLIFEVRREAALEDMESAQIAAGLQEGKTPQELAMSGLTNAVDPKVL